MYEYLINDERGDVLDALPMCSDACHRDYAGDAYAGWNGALEAEHTTWCVACGVVIPGETVDGCYCQYANVVVNRIRTDDGEKCEHGNWIQVPAAYLVTNPMGGM